MATFAFIIHPIDPKRDVSRKYPFLGKIFNEKQINYLCTFFPPVFLSEVTGIVSQDTGKSTKGWLIACPLTATRMLELPERIVYRKIIQTGRLAERLGADILGLGAFTSVIGDGGISIARALDIPVTTGNAYTISVAVQAAKKAAEHMEINLSNATAAIVGAAGAIGRACAKLIASDVANLYLIGRTKEKVEALKHELQDQSRAAIIPSTNLNDIRHADILLTVSSATHALVEPEQLKSGSVVCDVARPRDVSAQVAAARDDVLVIDGGMVDVPGNPNFNFDFGLPPGKAYACMAETIALAMQEKRTDYSLGKNIPQNKIVEIERIANKHGFSLGGFRSFEKSLLQEDIEKIKQKAKQKLS